MSRYLKSLPDSRPGGECGDRFDTGILAPARRFPRARRALLIALLCAGCGPTPQPADPQAPPAQPGPPVAETQRQDPSPPAPPARRETETGAADAAQTALKALQQGDLVAALDFLPPDYQADLDGLVQEFANRMDPELWERLGAVIRKSILVLKSRKDWILELDLIRDLPEAPRIRSSWDTMVGFLDDLGTMKTLDLDALKTARVRTLLPGKTTLELPHLQEIGRRLGANLTLQLSAVSIKALRTNGAEQVIGIQSPLAEQPAEVVYVQHEGHWIPKSLADHWDAGITNARQELQALPERLRTVRPQVLDGLAEAEAMLDQLLAAENRTQFEQAAGAFILNAATAWPRIVSLARQATTGQTQAPAVILLIDRELTERELKGLVAGVLAPLRDAGSDYSLVSNNGQTLCRILRVTDVDDLVGRVVEHFKLPRDAVVHEAESHTIRVDLEP